MIALLSLSSYAATTTSHARFNEWMEAHHKTYATMAAETQAFATWSHNDAKITEHNAKMLSYTLNHNEYSDMETDAFFAMKLGFAANATRTRKSLSTHVKSSSPSSIDWVSLGAVTSVKNQGSCGSCWSFSAAGAIEGAYQISSGTLLNLSEEDLVQCDTTDSGCNGGLMDNAFTWVETNGIASLSSYPYTSSGGTTGSCDSAAKNSPAVYVSGYTDVTAYDEDALKSAVAQQPVSVAIEADKSAFQFYSSGVLDSTACGTSLDHGVLLVGYGYDSSSGKDYWKVKNSWGSTWGEDGYIRMVRGKNMCGISQQASYPTGATSAALNAAKVVEQDAPNVVLKHVSK